MNKQELKKLEQRVGKLLAPLKTLKNAPLLALSGGPDSIFLLEMLLLHGFPPLLAHLNHQTRPECDQEEQTLTQLAAERHLQFFSKKISVPTLSKSRRRGLEETGRTERYKFLRSLAQKHHCPLILTAHHADDNLETIIMNFSRGASLTGLAGMSVLDGSLLRPLLPITKQEILAYLHARQIPYLSDPSNLSRDFTRNRIRHDIIPLLQAINPNLVKTTADNTQLLRETVDFLTKKAHSWLTRHPDFPLKPFRRLHPALQKAILRHRFQSLTGHLTNFSNKHCDEILHLIHEGTGKKEKTFQGVKFWVEGGKLHSL